MFKVLRTDLATGQVLLVATRPSKAEAISFAKVARSAVSTGAESQPLYLFNVRRN